MAEQTPTGTDAGKQSGAQGDAGQAPKDSTGNAAGSVDAGERTFTQTEVNRINAEYRRKAEAESTARAELEAKLAEVQQAQMSEHEKAIAQARTEERELVESEHRIALRALKIEAAIGPKLADIAPAIAAKVPADTPMESIADKVREIIDSSPIFKALDQPGAAAVDAGGGIASGGAKEGWITEAQLHDPSFYRDNKDLVENAVRNNWVR